VKGGKGGTSESGICAPFIASWPGVVEADRTSNALIDFTDLFPTFLALAGRPITDEIEIGGEKYIIDGRSFADVLLENQPRSQREWIMSMGGGNHAKRTDKGVENQYTFRDRVLRNERFKVLVGPDRQPAGLFDLQEDPHEKENLLKGTLSDSARQTLAELMEVAAAFPPQDADPRYIPNPQQSWDVPVTAESEVWKISE
jgi:arylsulfatase A-like enzyme